MTPTALFAHRNWAGIATLLASAAVVACVAPREAPATIDSTVTLAAHDSHRGVVIDQMLGGHPAALEPKGSWHWGTEPVYVLMEGGAADATLSVASPARVLVRRGFRADAAVVDRVEPSWENGALRLTLEPEGAPPLRTDVFARTASGAGPSALSRQAQLALDIPGTYEATIHTPEGRSVGWIRVRIGTRNGSARYEAVLPPSVDEPLAAATVQALSSEISFIEQTADSVSRKSEER